MTQHKSENEFGEEEWMLKLDKYQRDNLLMLLQAVHEIEPFTAANNGDWVGEITWMISDSGKLEKGDHPNASLEDLQNGAFCPGCFNFYTNHKEW